MDDIKIGFCQCCGRSVKLINPKGKKQSEWDTIATNMCDCQKKGKKTMHKEKLTDVESAMEAMQVIADRWKEAN